MKPCGKRTRDGEATEATGFTRCRLQAQAGFILIEMLNILERYPLSSRYGHNSARYVHVLSETMKLAYADRSEYLGDPDFSPDSHRTI